MVKQVFDNKIDDSRCIEIKIPVHFPALTNWDGYASVAGQIKLNEAYYNYVRLKVTQDTVYFMCLPNTAKTRLVKADIITAKEISDLPISKNSHNPAVKKVNLPGEYNLHIFQYKYLEFGVLIKNPGKPAFTKLSHPFIESPGKPPNFSS